MAGLSDIPIQINETLKLVKENRDRLNELMGEAGDYSQKHADAAYKLSQSISSLSREGRSWASKVQKDLKSMSLKQKIEVMVAFASGLSKADRRKLYGRLDDAECDRPAGQRVTFQIG